MHRTNISYRPDQKSKMKDIREWTHKSLSQNIREWIDSVHAKLSKTNTNKNTK